MADVFKSLVHYQHLVTMHTSTFTCIPVLYKQEPRLLYQPIWLSLGNIAGDMLTLSPEAINKILVL